MAKSKRVNESAASSPAAGEAAAIWVPIDDLVGWKDNPRNITPDHVAEVAKSIRRFGFGPPIVARTANKEIIAGHTRLLAAQKLKLPTVPVRFMDLDPAEAHILALADNKLGENGEWNDELLHATVGMLVSAGEDLLDGTGFGQSEIDSLCDGIVDKVDDEEAGPELGEDLAYSVVVKCKDERDQSMLLERLERDGYSCKPLIS